MKNNEKQPESSFSMDNFSEFMFGRRKAQRKTENPTVDNSHSVLNEETGDDRSNLKEETSFNFPAGHLLRENNFQRRDPFDWVLPGRLRQRDSTESQFTNIQKILENIDYLELIENIETIIESAKKFKPLLSNLKPFLKSSQKK